MFRVLSARSCGLTVGVTEGRIASVTVAIGRGVEVTGETFVTTGVLVGLGV